MWIDTCQHTYQKHPTTITLSIVCAGKLLETSRAFLHNSFQLLSQSLSQFHEALISISHGVSIHCSEVKEIHAFFFKIQMVIENHWWWNEITCYHDHTRSYVLAFTICCLLLECIFVLYLKLQKTFLLQLLCR